MGVLFVWVDKGGRLDDERSLVERGDRLDAYGLSPFGRGRAVIGLGTQGVFPTGQHEDGDRCTCLWGELYNRAELGEVTGAADASSSAGDAGRMAALIDRFGAEGLERANGQFALVQWDATRGRLLAAVDRFSILPLRWYEDDDRLIVAADARMILACPNVDDRLDPQAIYDYVALSVVPAPLTVYRSVRKLPPRHVLSFDGQTSVRPYCRLSFPESAVGSRSALGRELRRVIARAVERRRQADPPDARIGAFLSGGLDSSTVVGVLAGGSGDPVRAFSIGFGESRFDEMRYAKLAVSYFGAEHHIYTVTADDTVEVVDALLDRYDEPFGNSSAVAVYCCARLAAETGVDTLYAGDGGDEIFAGNPHYLWDRYFQIYHAVPRWLRRGLIEPVVNHCPMGGRIRLVRKARSYLRRAYVPNPDRIAGYGFLQTVPPEEVFCPEFLATVDPDHPMAVRRDHYHGAGPCSEINRILCQELALVVADNDLRKVTEMSARAGVRVVYPMLDPELVAFAGTIPGAWHLRGFKLRAFYKRAMRGFLPAEILAKRKMGFGLPISVWLKQDPRLRERMMHAFEAPAAATIFRDGMLADLRRRLDTDETNFYGTIAWVLLILLEWLDRRGTTPTFA